MREPETQSASPEFAVRGHDDTKPWPRSSSPMRCGQPPAAAARQAAHPKGGRPWIEDRAVLGGIIYVLRAGVPWRLLPARELVWLLAYRRLTVRYERRADILTAFLHLACPLIYAHILQPL
jgi:transposase